MGLLKIPTLPPGVIVASRWTEVQYNACTKSVCVMHGSNVSLTRAHVSIIVPVQMWGVCRVWLVPPQPRCCHGSGLTQENLDGALFS